MVMIQDQGNVAFLRTVRGTLRLRKHEAELMSRAAVSVRARPRSSAAGRVSRRLGIFLPAAFVGAVLAIVGFWARYFGPLLSGMDHQPTIIQIHAAVMVTWLVLFMMQVWFAASGQIRLHIRLGRWVMGYAIVVVAVGLLATSEGFAARLAAGYIFAAQTFLFGPIRDLVFFVPFLAATWIYRKRPEIHKRAMLVATTILVLPAVSRMAFLGVPVPLWKFMLVWPLPVYLAMVHDFRTKRLVHPVYALGIAAMLTMRLVVPLNTSPAWQAVAAHITAFYQKP
jgi:hypothetical protein